MKRFGGKVFAIVCAVMMFTCIFCRPTLAKKTLIIGDVTCDGEVNMADAVALLRYCVNMYELDFTAHITSDVTGDGEINTADAVLLLRCLIFENDYIQPIEIIGDIMNPILYTDIEYKPLAISHAEENVTLSEYTSDAVKSPKNTVAFGQGYSVELKSETGYVFETHMSDEQTRPDTVLYLLDNLNNVILSDDNSGDGDFSRIEFYAWEGGTYKILVTGESSSDTGLCSLSFGERVYITPPPETPTPKPTATPTPKPTTTPTPTPTSPIIEVDNIVFVNESVPSDYEVIQYRSSYSLQGVITAEDAITRVKAVIYNKSGDVEMSASKTLSADLNLKRYALTDGGSSSIDGQLKFSDLSIGTKRIEIFCTTKGNSEKLIFNGRFYVGATDAVLNGNAYSSSAQLSQAARQDILAYLNGMNENSIRTKMIMEAFTKLGITYGTGSDQLDCSSLVQVAFANVGISLPRTSCLQAKFCYDKNGVIPTDERAAGDLVFFTQKGCNCSRWHEIHHVAIYIGKVDDTGYYIEASSGKKKIVLRRAWGDTGDWAIDFYSNPY